MIIKNARYESGSAISTTSSLTLNNVTFINCSGDDGPNKDNSGAIQALSGYLKINNCNYIWLWIL